MKFLIEGLLYIFRFNNNLFSIELKSNKENFESDWNSIENDFRKIINW